MLAIWNFLQTILEKNYEMKYTRSFEPFVKWQLTDSLGYVVRGKRMKYWVPGTWKEMGS